MPSTYSSNLKIELMSTGENSGTWGNITNTNLGTALEQAIVGYGTVDYLSDANLTISITNSNSAQAARALVLNVTSSFGSLTQTRELVVPTIEKQYIVQNNTTGSQSITVKTSAGTGITVPNGRKAHLYVDGTNVIQMFDFVDINGGAIDGTPIGGSSASTGSFTTLGASGAATFNGAVTLGDAAADLLVFNGTINSHLLFTDNTYDIGASGATRPRNLFLAGNATVGGNLSVGGTLTLTGGVNLNGNVTVGDNASDTLTINSTITSNLIFTDNTYDIGASGATRPRNLFLAGSGTIGGNVTTAGRVIVDDTTDSTSATTGSIQTDGGLGIAKALFVGTSVTINGGTANGVAYLNGSKVLTTGSALTFDGTNLGIGVTASNAFEIGGRGNSVDITTRFLTTNASGGSTRFQQVVEADTGLVTFSSDPGQNGSARGFAFSIGGSERMRLTSTGNVGIGTSSPTNALSVSGNANITGNTTLGDASTDTVQVNGYMGVGGTADPDYGLYIKSSALTGVAQVGFRSSPVGTSGATTSVRAVLAKADTAAAAFTVADVAQFWASNSTKGAGSTITNQHGLYIADQTQGTNNFGITSLVSSGSNKWNIYASGTAANYFAGDVLVGATTGRVGNSITPKMQLEGTSAATSTIMVTRNSADANPANLYLAKSRAGTLGSNTIVSSGDQLGAVYFFGADGTQMVPAAYINAVVDGTPGVNDMPGRLSFWTTPDGSPNPAERFRLGASEAVFNDPGNDYDFRVESDTNTHALFVQGSDGAIGMGTSSPAVSGVEISRATGSATPTPVELRLSTTTSASDWSPTDPWGRLSFYNADASSGGAKIQGAISMVATGSTGGLSNMLFQMATSTPSLETRMAIDVYGGLYTYPIVGSVAAVFNEDGVDADFRVESDAQTHMLFVDAGNNKVRIGDDTSTDGVLSVGIATESLVARIGGSLTGSDGVDKYIRFQSKTSGGSNRYADLRLDVTNDRFDLYNPGPSGPTIPGISLLYAGGVVVNENGLDADFRVESDTNTHALFVDAGNSAVGINTSTPDTTYKFTVGGTGGTSALVLHRTNTGLGGSKGIVGWKSVNGYFTASISEVTDAGSDDGGGIIFRAMTGSTTTNPYTVTERTRITSDGYLRMASGTGGIQFNGDTAAANALDDYEEGTWTPVFSDASSGGNTATYSSAGGTYTKIGRVVHFTWFVSNINTSGMTGANSLFIQGLPFTSTSSGFTTSSVYANLVTQTANYTTFIHYISTGVAYSELLEVGTNNLTRNVTIGQLASGTADIRVSGTYHV